jgi:signal transduction histidine kinase
LGGGIVRGGIGDMTTRVVLLASVHVAMATFLTKLAWGAPANDFDLPSAAALAAAFAVVGLLPVNVELGRHATSVTLVDAVLVVGLFIVPDARAIAIAAVVGELLACAVARQAPLKVLYNAAATLGTVTLAARTFALVVDPDPTRPATWALTLAAVMVYAISNHASTSAVLTVVSGRRFHDLFVGALVPAATATAVSSGLGITVVVLFAASPWAPMLLAPLGAAAYAAFRAVGAHRSDSLRFERLYEASSRTGSLRDLHETLFTVAAEARELVGGTFGVAASPDAEGTWTAVVVGDRGRSVASTVTVDAVRALAAAGDDEVPVSLLPRELAEVAPGARDAVVASADGDVSAILVVFREVADDQRDARIGVLAAFAGHAALATTNARLFAEVEASLRRQIDLNRQKDEFLASLSHELRTPLTSVLGALSTLRQHGSALDASKREFLEEMGERQALRLRRLIEDLLLVAATDAGLADARAEVVDVASLLSATTAAAGSSVAVSVEIERGTPSAVHTDPARVRQILDALLDNASKFAPGPVELVASPVPGGVSLAVRDHGPGIRVEDRERVFERFVQLDQSATRQHGGTGIGLYLSTKLAELLGGTLAVSDTPGGGATFGLTLPGADTAPSSTPTVDEDAALVTTT